MAHLAEPLGQLCYPLLDLSLLGKLVLIHSRLNNLLQLSPEAQGPGTAGCTVRDNQGSASAFDHTKTGAETILQAQRNHFPTTHLPTWYGVSGDAALEGLHRHLAPPHC
jgi:hypothetical protein